MTERMRALVIVRNLGMGIHLSGNRIEAISRHRHGGETDRAAQLLRIP